MENSLIMIVTFFFETVVSLLFYVIKQSFHHLFHHYFHLFKTFHPSIHLIFACTKTMNNNHVFPTLTLHLVITISFFLIVVPVSHCQNDDHQFSNCTIPYPYICGSSELNISYPFWGGQRPQFCGLGHEGFEIKCQDDHQYHFIEFENQKFRVSSINYESHPNMTIARESRWNNYCPGNETQDTVVLDPHLFNYSPNVGNLSFFHCQEIRPQHPGCFNCSLEVEVITGFGVEYLLDRTPCSACYLSSEKCGSNQSAPGQFSCYCRDYDPEKNSTCPTPTPTPTSSPPERGPNRIMKTIIGVGAGLGGMGIMAMIFVLYRCRKKYAPTSYVSRNISSDPSSVADLEKADKILGVQVFSYTELEEATNHFDSAKELGDGGFGTVYYGKLQDGRAVAVKRLYENNYKRVEQFMNEVEILAHLRHTNLVTLYGCTSRHSRELLLVYEYVSNGTVADHLHGELTKPPLPWVTRLNIAIETACALKYLHASDIIHRDVKTNNILLDNNFSVKVADFGLSRLFPNHVTHVSTAPQGTPGYVDPEYHQCYQLTDKSDVFSFGVVLVELISSMPAVDITRHRHEINLSNLAIHKIQNKALHELVDPSLGFESDYKVRKMIYSVAELAFQCLQSDKDLRPFMTAVLDTLKDIQSDGYSKEKAEEFDITDDVGLLKHGPPTPSPDSQTSRKTTPSSSN